MIICINHYQYLLMVIPDKSIIPPNIQEEQTEKEITRGEKSQF